MSFDASGGWKNEAIEVALWHAMEQHERDPLAQIIIIGDMPPNTKVRSLALPCVAAALTPLMSRIEF